MDKISVFHIILIFSLSEITFASPIHEEVISRTKIISGCDTREWTKCKESLEKHLSRNSTAYKQLQEIKQSVCIPLSAAHSGYIELVRVMLNNGLPINEKIGDLNFTMLHLAAENGHNGLVKLLIKEGADVYVRDASNNTPLHSAAATGQEITVQLLIESGTDVNVINNGGDTALHEATRWNHKSAVDSLISKQSDKSMVNNIGETALDIARARQHYRIMYESFNQGRIEYAQY